MTKWDLRLLDLAAFISTWSKDPSTKVGAVIAMDRRIISMGYNGLPQRISDDMFTLEDRALKYDTIIHAEMNALLFARGSVVGASLYTFPFQPCSRCASMVIQAGIARVVAPPPIEHWKNNCELSARLFSAAGVELEIVSK